MNSKYTSQIRHMKRYYKRFPIDFRIEELEKFKEICKKNNTTPTTEIKNFVKNYIKNNS